jgi:hypothetical protein
MVDSQNHTEVINATADKNNTLRYKVLGAMVGPPVRAFFPGFLSPTKELGKFLVDLAMSDGAVLKGDDVEKGRIIPNKAVRRMAKEQYFGV